MDGGTTTPRPDDSPVVGQDGQPADVVTVGWEPDEAPHPGRLGGLVQRLARNPRTAMVIASLGAVALFIALTDDWIMLRLPDSTTDGVPLPVPRTIVDLGVLGTAYLLGTLALLGCLALVLFGSVGVRHNARVLGLAMAGGIGGVLLALTTTMDNHSIQILYEPNEEIGVTASRGMVMAYVATVAFALALLLAAPHGRAVTAERDGVASDWSWRRSRPTEREPDGDVPPSPTDLTVMPASPFAQPDPPITRPVPRPSGGWVERPS